MKKRILFLCTGHAARRQMAEGIANAFHGDVVVTVCDSAAQDCPMWSGAKRIEHWPIEDPSFGEGDALQRFIVTRDELTGRIDELVQSL